MNHTSETRLNYVVGDQSFIGSFINAKGDTSRAAVVLLPDWRGQSTLAFDHANHLAELGCVVAIADLYGDGFNPDSPDDVGPMVKHLIEHRSEGVEALAACVAALQSRIPGDIPLYCLGFSAGGMVALDYGRSGADIAGIVLCSALLKTAVAEINTKINAPLLVLQGTQDQVSSIEVIDSVIAEMDAAGNDARFVLYSQTHHAFDNPEAGTDPAARLCYSLRSSQRARAAIEQFLNETISNKSV